ncbi:deoxycytidylate deaminase-like isoform X1 [Lineus longissimus]|uniref:deoxycytidylate deaminase-like isoform X1 n=1 Tax=Lineus longissimus TaxID=88925 RepID=UPI002B4D5059
MATGETENIDQGYLGWEEYFMGMAAMAAQRSKNTVKVGAVLINPDKKIVGVGYNGMPLHIPDGNHTEQQHNDLMCDAQTNAILFRSVADLSRCVMYTTCFPTMESAKIIIQSKITHLYYLSHGNQHIPNYDLVKKLLGDGDVKSQPFKPSRRKIDIDFFRFGEVSTGVTLQSPTT